VQQKLITVEYTETRLDIVTANESMVRHASASEAKTAGQLTVVQERIVLAQEYVSLRNTKEHDSTLVFIDTHVD
jgi:hypothetical protein